MTGPSASLETDDIANPSILPISVSISLIWLSALAPVGPMKTASTLSAAAGLLNAGLDEWGELVRDVMIGDVDVERLSGLDFRLDPIGEREVAELRCGIARERRHSDRSSEEDVFEVSCLVLPC